MSQLEREIAGRLAARLGIAEGEIDVREPFESYGLDSAEAISLSGELEEWLGRSLPETLVYTYPTIEALARYLEQPEVKSAPVESATVVKDEPLALVGMACRFPGGATSPEAFWQLLHDGRSAVTEVPADRWDIDAYYDPDPDAPQKMYTRRGAFLDDLPGFDAAFFGISPREALRMDPQQRLLLEVAWEALERAGHAPERLAGSRTGVFVGMMSEQQYAQLQVSASGSTCLDDPYFGIGSAASVAAGRLSYLMDFRGPALTVDTACSSSLVALHLASQSLRSGECHLAIVGGVNAITLPESMVNACKMGMLAVDGRCKTFDAAADGFALGEGCGVVVLERYSDAVAHGHPVLAIIRGSAVNQDGLSNGLTAPNKTSQVDVIRRALASAGVTPDQIGYVEAHGSGTLLGDAIEIQALGEALAEGRSEENPLVVGAVKTNIGHLAGAAGMAGLIKATLALQHGEVPPNLNLSQPNPTVTTSDWPMLLPAAPRRWESETRRAGVSSFGWSGTNAHVVLEAAPVAQPAAAGDGPHLLLLSANTPTALAATRERLAGYLKAHPAARLADVAHTTRVGRNGLRERQALVCRTVVEAIEALETPDASQVLSGVRPRSRPPVAFMLPGVGDYAAGMGRELYESEPVFRACIDRCADILQDELGLDLRQVVCATDGPSLGQTGLAQPVQFVMDYALAQLWMAWGVQPEALIGYSLGEYVAACLAGVFSEEDALRLVARRARLIEGLPPAAMVAVALSEAEIEPWLTAGVWLAAVNGPAMCVIAGEVPAVEALEERLAGEAVAYRRMRTEHAFHSPLLQPIEDAFVALVSETPRQAPRVPFVSNVSGTWITPEEATDPRYWARHMLGTVRFADGLAELARASSPVLLEVGPGQTLTSLALQILPATGMPVIGSMRSALDPRSDSEVLLRAAGRLWLAGVELQWEALHAAQTSQRVALPTYPFEHQRFWIERTATQPTGSDLRDWFYAPTWRRSELAGSATPADPTAWLVFLDEGGVGDALAARLAEQGHVVTRASAGPTFARLDDGGYTVRRGERSDYAALLRAVGTPPREIAHVWGVGDEVSFDEAQERGFYSLLALTQALEDVGVPEARITVVADALQRVHEADLVQPAKATVLGPCKVAPQEYPHMRYRVVDADRADDVFAELTGDKWEVMVAYRDGQRYVQAYEPTPLDRAAPGVGPLRERGTYLITGGLGGIGLVLARHLAERVRARLVLTGRTGLPPREEWDGPHDTATAERVRQVRELENLGAEVLVLQADVSDEASMRTVIQHAGPLNGVIHAAGLVGEEGFFHAIRHATRATCEAHFAPKARGLLVLERVLADQSLDFCFLLSSMSAVLGGLGFSAYAGANAFLDAFAARHGPQWISINWDTWRTPGQAPKTSGALGMTLATRSLSADEGRDAFDRILASGATHLVVSTADLQERIRHWITFDTDAATAAPLFPRPALAESYSPATTNYERRLADLWREALGIDTVGVNDNFFDLGGNSLIGMQLLSRVKKEFDVAVPAVALFEAPTIAALARYLAPGREPIAADATSEELDRRRRAARRSQDDHHIAIIGMAGRFPGATSVERLWQNLQAGAESISFFDQDELQAAGVDPRLLANPNYVKARPILDGIEDFDAAFFGYSPREAQFADPQQRIFLECAFEALGDAGYAPDTYKGLIGVFAGSNISTYLLGLLSNPAVAQSMNDYQLVGGNDKDALTTTVSYRLNLRGPSMAVQTFCSTSLVATHQACQSLVAGESDIALAGGVSLRIPQKQGYLYSEGGQESPDGHVRTFDARAGGAVFGDGVGLVVLKRLEDAMEDGDHIYAVIRGSAVNNDGSLKVGYTAPSVAGQADAVTRALEAAGVTADSISYVEAHGSATELGDPIEVAALTRAFRQTTDRTGYCAIGSVKSNVGHLDRAAGVTGLIKTALALRHGQIPPSLHFESPNPEIDFDASPFVVSTHLQDWHRNGTPRRAGVNSLGMGGTNVHVVLEEAPPTGESSADGRPLQLIPVSARSTPALEALTNTLADHLGEHAELPLPDVAYTLRVGRTAFDQRRAVLAADTADAIAALRDPARQLNGAASVQDRPVAFLLPGVGDHFVGMGQALYEHEPVFRSVVDRCCELLRPQLGVDLRTLLFPAKAEEDAVPGGSGDLRALLGRGAPPPTAGPLAATELAQPAVFVVEYALAELLASWGVRPWALIGYSLGEYVAACLAGVFTLEDALRVVATRARAIQAMPAGSMLTVGLAEEELRPRLSDELDVAAVNGPSVCVVAGPPAAVAALESELLAEAIACRRLDTTHAFHSRQMAPAAATFEAWLRQAVTLRPPTVPYVSNVTGTWVTPEQATDPSFWARHLQEPVRFGDGLATLLESPDPALLEVGPGQGLGAFVRQHPACGRDRLPLVLATLGAAGERRSALEGTLTAAARLWLNGASIDWSGLSSQERRRRVPLPTYVFERQRFWIEPTSMTRPSLTCSTGGVADTSDPALALASLPRRDADDWFYLPGWKQTPSAGRLALAGGQQWLVFDDDNGVGLAVGDRLTTDGHRVVHVRPGSEFAQLADDVFVVNPRQRADFVALLRSVPLPDRVLHLWTLGTESTSPERRLELGFHSLMGLAQVLGDMSEGCAISVVSSGSQAVADTDVVVPEHAAVAGPCKVVPLEYPTLRCRAIDVLALSDHNQLADQILGEILSNAAEPNVALRGRRRWVPTYEPVPMQGVGDGSPALRERGVYLITGGLGGLGLSIARHLAQRVRARLVLVGRNGLPPRETWRELVLESDQVRAVVELEALGADVLAIAADVTRATDMRRVVDATLARFGALHGVIHAAGVPGMGLMQFKTPEQADNVLAPKVAGTLVLEEVLGDMELDFCVLFSSISSITSGGPGQVDYCAANAFLDAFAQRNATRFGRTVAINWSEWQWNAWDDALGGYDQTAQDFFRETRARFGISASEGAAAFERALGLNLPQVIVATQDFPSIVDLSRRFSIATLLQQAQHQGGTHPRPNLAVSFVEPSTPLERQVADLWCAALGLEEVGVHDSFFDLGGNSLIGIDLISKLRRVPGAENLAPHVLYEAPTVKALTRLLEADRPTESMGERQERGERRRASLQHRRMRS